MRVVRSYLGIYFHKIRFIMNIWYVYKVRKMNSTKRNKCAHLKYSTIIIYECSMHNLNCDQNI
jgi:hypothetical protein